MRVLVTGHEGYIGAHLVPLLRERGHDVVGIDMGYFRGQKFGPEPEPVPTVGTDVRDLPGSALEGIDAVVHLAALSNDAMGSIDSSLTVSVNFEATARLAKLARDAGVGRFLFSSSCSVYGAGDAVAATESAPLRPLTPYAESKARSEEALDRLAAPGFSVVSLRSATAFGASPRLRTDLVVNDFVSSAACNGVIVVKSSGTARRPLVHAQDIARTFTHLVDAPVESLALRVFNVGQDSENYEIRDLARIVGELVPSSSVSIGTSKDGRDYLVDFTRLHTTFPGLGLKWSVRDGAADLLAQIRSVGLTGADLAADRLVRLRELERLRASGRLDETLRWTAA